MTKAVLFDLDETLILRSGAIRAFIADQYRRFAPELGGIDGAAYAARFLAASLAALRDPAAPPTTILVATSGDTGAAVASAFHRRDGFKVVILYPDGKVSPRQAHGLGCWGDNVRAFEVDGPFDACQALVKAAFTDPGLQSRHRLTAANSINIGRLLPQVAYHVAASLWHWRKHRTAASSIRTQITMSAGIPSSMGPRCFGFAGRTLALLSIMAAYHRRGRLPTMSWNRTTLRPSNSITSTASATSVSSTCA